MTTYRLKLHLPSHHVRTLTVSGGTPAELAQAVYQHARGTLGSRRVSVELDPVALTGSVIRLGVPAGTFTLELPEPEPAAPQVSREAGFLWGWTLQDIEGVTHHVLNVGRWWAADSEEHFDTVRYAIVEHLLTADAPPSRRDLMAVGLRAGDDRVAREMH
ncbi:hypothetical protein, partial [Streptomyces triculaminicus]|uniref:hypothetical protein n=1 Tax=Streptomyces triculaminicus TaxID=2816232 RepID=UPI00379072B8